MKLLKMVDDDIIINHDNDVDNADDDHDDLGLILGIVMIMMIFLVV